MNRSKPNHPVSSVICFAHKKYKTGALGAARSQEKVRNVRTGRPQPRCMMPDRSMRSRSWHPAQKAHSESARSTKSRPNRGHFLRTQKYKTDAIGAARCDWWVCNVRIGRPQPRCMMPDRAMRSRSWPSSAESAIRIRPRNIRCHLLRTQEVQSRCARSRPIAQKGAQRAHGPPAAPMHHA